MARAVTIAERTRIIEALQSGMSRNEAARTFDRGSSTISRIAREAGIVFDRAQTKVATAAKQADNRARRTDLNRKLLDRAHDLVDSMDEPFLATHFGGKDNTFAEQLLDRPTDTAIRNLMVAVGIAVQRSLELEKIDMPDDAQGGLQRLVDVIGAMREEPKEAKP